jgi:hypothetical protein
MVQLGLVFGGDIVFWDTIIELCLDRVALQTNKYGKYGIDCQPLSFLFNPASERKIASNI